MPGKNETFRATATGHTGRVLGTWTGTTIEGLISQVDLEAPSATNVAIRGEFTTDGTWWRQHGGRIVAVREGKTWIRF